VNFTTRHDYWTALLRSWLAIVLCLACPMAAWTQIFVANDGGTTVGEYNLSTGAAINASLVNGLGSPWGVVVSGNNLFVANRGISAIGEYNASTGAAINANFITGLNDPLSLALAGNVLFVANYNGNTVGAYNASTGAAINLSFLTLPNPTSLAVSGNTLYVGSNTAGRIGAYSVSTGATINANLVTGLAQAGFLAISGNTLYVSAGTVIGTYDATTGAEINANFITGLNLPDGLAIVGNTLYVANRVANTVEEYDASTGALINDSFITGLNVPFNIAVAVPPPSSLTYATSHAVYSLAAPISANAPSSTGGAVVTYSISPALPSGLVLDPASGIISGTPTAASAATNYTVIAWNNAGSTGAMVNIAVNAASGGAPPSALAYTANPAVYTIGSAVNPNTPGSSGGAPTVYSITPALPPGLGLSTTTGVIAGTPTVAAPAGNYLVTAANQYGSATAILNITVNSVTPSALVYSANPAVYTMGVAVDNDLPSSAGSPPLSYSVSPALPAGLTLNTATGAISGTPMAASTASNYTVKATNASGSTTAVLNITVHHVPPSALTYSANPAVYTLRRLITNNLPGSSGGPISSYSVSPALPAGLGLNGTTGVISGTPTGIVAASNFTVTATNDGGSTTAVLNITVNDVPPSALTYSVNPATYTVSALIVSNMPRSSGGAVVSYSVSPPLPAGLLLDPVAGTITGTPAAVAATNAYTITATNTGGSTTATLSLAVVSPVDAWRQQFFGTTANTGLAADTADAFHTGVSNLLAFAFFGPGQPPSLANISLLPQVQMADGNAFFSFTQPAGVSGIIYGAEWTPAVDSGNWQPIPDTGSGNIHIFSEPIGNNTQIFLRLKVTNP